MKVTHEDQRDPGDAFKRTCIGFYLTHHLKLAGYFPSEMSSYTSKDFFSVTNDAVVKIVSLFVRHLQSSSCNAYEIDELLRDSNQREPDQSVQLGGAVFPTVSLSNHHCGHNTIRLVICFIAAAGEI